MSVFADARAELAGKLTAAGLAVVDDPRAVPPFVLLDLYRSRPPASGIGTWPMSIPIRIVAPPPGDTNARDWMETQLEVVLRTLGYLDVSPGIYDTAGKDCPAYTVEYPINVPNPDC